MIACEISNYKDTLGNKIIFLHDSNRIIESIPFKQTFANIHRCHCCRPWE